MEHCSVGMCTASIGTHALPQGKWRGRRTLALPCPLLNNDAARRELEAEQQGGAPRGGLLRPQNVRPQNARHTRDLARFRATHLMRRCGIKRDDEWSSMDPAGCSNAQGSQKSRRVSPLNQSCLAQRTPFPDVQNLLCSRAIATQHSAHQHTDEIRGHLELLYNRLPVVAQGEAATRAPRSCCTAVRARAPPQKSTAKRSQKLCIFPSSTLLHPRLAPSLAPW